MTTTTELPINSLDYDGIRNNLITFLQSQLDLNGDPIYEDYNFQSSGISTLINLLSYNTHYIGYYVKMLLNESFIDSAVKRESLFSKAKLTGYLPKGRTASRAELKLSVNINLSNPNHYEPLSKSILIARGTSFSGINDDSDQRTFYLIDPIFMNQVNSELTPIINYTSDVFTVYEGSLKNIRFKIDTGLSNQRYIIQDKNIDVDTIRMLIIPHGSSVGEEYFLSSNIFEVSASSKVFYLTTQEDGLFEIIFGNNIFGQAPGHQSIVYVNYISSNGESGNGCKRFRFNKSSEVLPSENNIYNWTDMTVVTATGMISGGGNEIETAESLRFTIPYHYRRQNRIVTISDFKTILISEFRNIDSINVWGGESNIVKNYGKIYISIKPKFSDKLTLIAKNQIQNDLISKYCVVGMQPVFIDPEFINVEMTIYAKVDGQKTNKTFGYLEKQITDTLINYNTQSLNVFDNFLSDVTLLNQIQQNIPALKSCYSKKILTKDQTILYDSDIENYLYMGNPIQNGVTSSTFTYGNQTCYFADDANGYLYIYKLSDSLKLLEKTFGRIDYETGVIYYQYPKYARMVLNDFNTSGTITFSMIPVNPDIETFLQNIVRITKIRVVLSNA